MFLLQTTLPKVNLIKKGAKMQKSGKNSINRKVEK